MALASTVAFLVHSMLFFWNRFELPAVAHGLVTFEHPRMAGDQSSSSPERPLVPRLGEHHHHESTRSPAATASMQQHHNQQQQQQQQLVPRTTTLDQWENTSTGIPRTFTPRQSSMFHRSFSSSSTLGRSQEEPTTTNSSNMSHNTSSIALFQMGVDNNDDEEDSCLYMLGGEVVMQQPRRNYSIESFSSTAPSLPATAHHSPPRQQTTSISNEDIPLEVDTTTNNRNTLDLTPRMGSSSMSTESLSAIISTG